MFAVMRHCLFMLLFYGICSFGSELGQMDNMEQKWTIGCACEPNNSLGKELCDKRIELAKLEEKHHALLAQVDSQKTECTEKLAALKTYNDQYQYAKTTFYEREKIILQDNCELRIKLAVQNATLISECSQRLSLDAKTFPGMAVKDELIKLTTGHYHISAKNQKANWYMASNRCKALGLELASIESKEEDNALLKVLDITTTYWTSGSDLGAEGQFFWTSTGHQFGVYQNFDIGQPDNAGTGEHCLEYWPYSSGGLKWNDRLCEYVSRYICEYKST